MKYIFLLSLIACAHSEKPLQERQLAQCYLESDTYTKKIPFEAKMSITRSELGTITSAKVTESSAKDANLNACLSYVMMGAGRPLQGKEKAGVVVKNLKFKPDGKHEL